jgi:glycosyltransferase involved in cell wall biosynthesis
MHIAVIITTYNRPDALAAVLEGYLAQTDTDFEVLVADDGSTEATREVIDNYSERARFELKHIWQEDQGFRAAAARNRAIAATAADYVIFTDGDCIPLVNFVARHRALAQQGWWVSGNRVLLTESFTAQVLQKQTSVSSWGAMDWLAALLRGEINRVLPVLNLPLPASLRRAQPARWQGAKTCNLAVWRQDLCAVNGLDEAYSGWGMEDSDLVVRLLHAGIKHKSARFAAPVLHLWHAENDRGLLQKNQARLQALLQSTQIKAGLGLDQYL